MAGSGPVSQPGSGCPRQAAFDFRLTEALWPAPAGCSRQHPRVSGRALLATRGCETEASAPVGPKSQITLRGQSGPLRKGAWLSSH